MSNTVIHVEHLSKQFHIGAQAAAYRTFREAIQDAVAAPFRRVGSLLRGQASGVSELNETFWALRDVSFEIKEGEVVGIIGRNGAGKSTLLKILSRITEPTEGRVLLKGRVGSLLEVGTGFHPELTGRENVSLNGAILGMSRQEIERKFDEIIAFAEIERFVDTPVKHYSSGMYMRLAFAVAAFLEPEILIIDEVLAVGDAAFQKKCLGKMGEVAGEGRTVLFVSHNMAAVNDLCTSAIWLQGGEVRLEGRTEQVTSAYLVDGTANQTQVNFEPIPNSPVAIHSVALFNNADKLTNSFDIKLPIRIRLNYEIYRSINDLEVSIKVRNTYGVLVFTTHRSHFLSSLSQGAYLSEIEIPALKLSPGNYLLDIFIHVPHKDLLVLHESAIGFEVEETGSPMALYQNQNHGVVMLEAPWRDIGIHI